MKNNNPSRWAGWRITVFQPVKRFFAGRHFYHSITFKNLALFVAIFLVALAPLAFSYWQDVKEVRIANLATQLELIAEQAIRKIDPQLIYVLKIRELTGSKPHRQLVNALKDIQDDFQVDNAVLMRKTPEGGFNFIADGNSQFYINQPVFLHERFPETLVAALGAWENKGTMHTELFGFGTYEYLQFNKPVTIEGKVIAVLMINKFAEDVDQAIRMDTLNVLVLTSWILILGGIFFWVISTRLLRPLMKLKDATNRIATGDFDIEIRPLKGMDEVAQLNESFRVMVKEVRIGRENLQKNNEELKRTLGRVRMMEDLEKNLSKFVPQEVRKALGADPEALEKGKIEKDVTVLFLDVEGSTVLTESMEPTKIDHLIEDYFSRYLDFIYENQGDITETAGDGLMLIFQGDDPAEHALNAVKTAVAIQQVTREIWEENKQGEDRLRINIGINSGTALVGFTKFEAISGTRITFTATGRTTIVSARLQDLAKDGNTLISKETMGRVSQNIKSLGAPLELEDLGIFELKNLNDPEQVFRLKSGSGQ